MRLTRAIWGLLAIMLLAVGIATWYLTRPGEPERPWLGLVGTLAGSGQRGWLDDAASSARFSEPFGLVVSPDGSVFVSDAGDSHRIRRIGTDRRVTTLAGGGRGFADGRGAAARFATPSAIALAADGTLVVADTGNHAIRRVTLDGVVTTVAGDGITGYRDGPASEARFSAPVGVAVDARGRIFVADTYNDRIRIVDTDGQVRTLAGSDLAGYADGAPFDARFDTPCGIAVSPDGRVFVADTGNGLVRAIAPDGAVSTIPVPSLALERPIGLAFDVRGDLFIADEAGRIAVMPASGAPRLLAGGATGYADGTGSDARFRRPSGLAAATSASGERLQVVVADPGNALVRLVRPSSAVPTEPSAAQVPVAPVRAGWQLPSVAWPWRAVPLEAPPPPRIAPAFDEVAFARTPLLWPIGTLDGPHEVAGTFAEARGGEGQERFHAGIDIREPAGTPVRAVRDGIVSSPISSFAFDTLNEGVRIGDIAYVHIRAGRGPGMGDGVPGAGTAGAAQGTARGAVRRAAGVRHPKVQGRQAQAGIDLDRFAPVLDASGSLTRMRVKRGAFFATGDLVGSVNRFNHVHLNVGWPGEEINPLHFRLVRFVDTIAPTIAVGGVRLFDEAGQPLNPDRLVPVPARRRGRPRPPRRLPPLEPAMVRGRVRIVVDGWDRAEGNTASRRLGIYALGYQVLTRTGTPAPGFETPRMTLRFDRMPVDRDAPRQVYAGGSGIPVYGASRTQFLYVVTTTYRDGIATPGWWDTTSLAPGEYVLRVFGDDFSGNRTTRDLRVVVVP